MTADEALPYLQVFTPLTFTSHVSPLPRADEDDAPLLQHHTITASSTSPRGLFTARIEMTVDTTTMAIASLAVPRLEPAAAAELGPFIDRIVVGGGKGGSNGAGADEKMPTSSSGLRNNVSVLGWAMGEWLRTAVQRAKVWIALEREVAGGKDALREMVARQRARGRRPRRRRRRKRWVEEEREEGDGDGDGDGHTGEDGDGDEEEEGGDGTVDGAGKGYAAADLLPFMGRTCMDLEVPVLDGGKGETSALRVQWRITFDWTGEARSEIGVLVGLPGKCEFTVPFG
jgi:hypothetical protein